MSVSSKTGLVPTQKRLIYVERQKKVKPEEILPTKNVARAAILSIRPLGGLFNPYAKGCSVLCNHPAPNAVRDIINQVKTTLTLEAKHLNQNDRFESMQVDGSDNIPEDLFRRYTDTDSRPMTPSPTITSIRTRTSAGSFLNARRCITPELGKNEMNKRKKLILDLRRSHSQETLYWKAPSEASHGLPLETGLSQTSEKKRPKSQKSEEKAKAPLIPEEVPEEIKKPPPCINDQDMEDEDVRRGKKRKKMKSQPVITTFHLSEDPETQVATLGPDSLNPSTRPSLIPNASDLLPNRDKRESQPILLKDSFLTDEAFKVLKTELDVDMIENTFDRYLNRALREAIKYVVPKSKTKDEIPIQKKQLEKGRHPAERKPPMPRKFSKSATRFEMPLDLKILENITVFGYLSKHVWVSRQRKFLYKKSFLNNLIETEPDADEPDDTVPIQYVERAMPAQNFSRALEEVLEFYGTPKIINEVRNLTEIENYSDINFRSWCGIVSFAERYALDDSSTTDSCDELEKADFCSMELRIAGYNISDNLRTVFDVIQRTHFMKTRDGIY